MKKKFFFNLCAITSCLQQLFPLTTTKKKSTVDVFNFIPPPPPVKKLRHVQANGEVTSDRIPIDHI